MNIEKFNDIISKIHVKGKLIEEIDKSIKIIGGWKNFKNGERILIKPNYNTSDPYPGSTDLEFLSSLISLLKDYGIKNILIGESTSMLNHRKVLKNANVYSLEKKFDVKVVIFDEEGFKKITLNRKYLKKVSIAKTLDKIDKIIYVCCPKTHHAAIFTGSLKLGMGFVNNWERTSWHFSHLQEKIAELNLILKPDFIFADMRKTFISGGPSKGKLEYPNLLLSSKNRIYLDVECIKVIKSFENNSIIYDPWDIPQISHAIKIGVDEVTEKSYTLIET